MPLLQQLGWSVAPPAGEGNAAHLADLDGAGCSWEARETGFERRHLGESPAATDVDACHPELVGRPWLQFHLLHLAVVWNRTRIILYTHTHTTQIKKPKK